MGACAHRDLPVGCANLAVNRSNVKVTDTVQNNSLLGGPNNFILGG